jgi:hypothetical protein
VEGSGEIEAYTVDGPTVINGHAVLEYDKGTTVHLGSCFAPTGWGFDHWIGDVQIGSDPGQAYVTMDTDKTVTGVFSGGLLTLWSSCGTAGIMILLAFCLAFGFLGRSDRDF